MKLKTILPIVYLLFISIFSWGQGSGYRLVSVDGKYIDNNIYTVLMGGKGTLHGEIVYLDRNGKIEPSTPYDNLVMKRVGYSKVIHYSGYRDGKWAVYNSKPQPVTNFEYDEIESIHNNVLAVKKGEFWGAVDTLGVQLLPFDYGYIQDYKGDFVELRNMKTKLFCLINSKGKVLIDARVEAITVIREDRPDLIAVKVEDKWGIMDSDGNEILPFEYTAINHVWEPNDPFSVVRDYMSFGAVDKNAKLVIDAKYTKIDIFPQGAIVFSAEDNIYYYFNDKGELKLTSKNEIIDTREQKIETKDDDCSTSYYNYDGTLIETIYNQGYEMSKPGIFYDCKVDLYGYSDGQKLVIPCIYDRLKALDNSHLEAMKNNKMGIIDINNKVLLPIKYKYFTKIGLNRCVVTTYDHEEILFDWDGKRLSSSKYYGIDTTYSDSTLLFVSQYNSKKWGVRDINGKQVIPEIYESVKVLDHHYELVSRDGKLGIFNNKTLKEELPCEYVSLFVIALNIVGFKSDGKTGAFFITDNGLKKIPSEYEEISQLSNGAIVAKKKGKFGVIDLDNNIKIPFEYDDIYVYYKDILVVLKW